MTPAEQTEAVMLLQRMELALDHIHEDLDSVMATFDRIEANTAAFEREMERWN